MRIGISFIIISVFILTSCTTMLFGEKLVLQRASFSELEGWENDNQKEALGAFLLSCAKIQQMPSLRKMTPGEYAGRYAHWQIICDDALAFSLGGIEDARNFFTTRFDIYKATNRGKDKGLFTGYFAIELEGSLEKQGEYVYPIYSRPPELENGRIYYSRKEIDSGMLENRQLEIAWAKDPVRLFFLHVQGSGQILLENGEIIRLGYNGKNNHKYKSIGSYLIEQECIKEDELSAEKVQEFLYNNPKEAVAIMQENPSYIFFKELKTKPVGAQGVELTEERSMAIDKRFIPYGVPLWLDVALQKTPNYEAKKYNRLVIAQDTGGAIKGAIRGDIFFGAGKRAEELAGYKNGMGGYYLLLPKGIMD